MGSRSKKYLDKIKVTDYNKNVHANCLYRIVY